jgi:hypothetical protein
MAWSDLTFTGCSVLTAAQMTQLQANFAALAQGAAGAPALSPTSLMWTGQASGAGLNVSSLGMFWQLRVTDVATLGALTLTASPQTPANGVLFSGDPAWRCVGSAGQPALQNNWAFDTSAGGGVAFRKLPTGLVSIQGTVTSGTAIGTTVFTLPGGYRPRIRIDRASDSGAAFGRLVIRANGNVDAMAGTTAWFSVCAEFMADG